MVSGGQIISQRRDPGRDRAITEIVLANGDLVYSTALRCLNGNQEDAKELAQSVFVDFSRKWAQLPADTIVPGWLYQHTRFLAARFIRGELRRRRREQEAMRRHEMNSGGTELWKMIHPILDDALAALNEGERNAVVLRFLRGMSFRETGGELGISEDAARMRVGRALGTLRGVLKSFGIDSTSSALSASLMLASLGGAPAGFAKATALTVSAAGGLPAGAWVVSIMNMTKMKMFVAGAALLVGGAVPVYLQVSLNRAEERHLTAMAEMGDALSSLQAEHDDLLVSDQKLRARLEQEKADRSELFKLRGTVNQLRSDKKRLENSLANSSGPESEGRAVEAEPVSTYSGFFNSEIGPDESVIAGGWRIGPGQRGFLVVHAEVDQSLGANTVVIKNGLLEATDEVARALELGPVPSDPSVETASRILNSEALDEYLKSEQEDGGLQFLAAPMVTTLGGRQATISTAEEIEIDGEPYQTGITLHVLPEIRGDGNRVGVSVISEWSVPSSEGF